MRAVLQRATSASVTVDGEVVGRIDEPGLVVLLGMTHDDGPDQVAWMVRKIRDLRIMREEQSVADLGAPVLVVSQFTLYGDARKGRRPDVAGSRSGRGVRAALRGGVRRAGEAGHPGREGGLRRRHGGELANDGPITMVLETRAAGPADLDLADRRGVAGPFLATARISSCTSSASVFGTRRSRRLRSSVDPLIFWHDLDVADRPAHPRDPVVLGVAVVAGGRVGLGVAGDQTHLADRGLVGQRERDRLPGRLAVTAPGRVGDPVGEVGRGIADLVAAAVLAREVRCRTPWP